VPRDINKKAWYLQHEAAQPIEQLFKEAGGDSHLNERAPRNPYAETAAPVRI
jgi:hypothetical protein